MSEPAAFAPARALVKRLRDAGDVADAGARFVVDAARRAIAERGSFRLALSGGKTPRALYERLAAPDLASRADFRAWHFFFGDERAVPPDDPASNFRMAREGLFDRAKIPDAQIHRMKGELGPERAAALYEAELGEVPMDLVLLGMGDDGHTASLFPGTPGMDTERRRVIATRSPAPPPDRISLTLAALNEARAVLFLVTGDGKAQRLLEVLQELESARPTFPAAKVRPMSGALHWFVDAGAAARLPEPPRGNA